MAYTDGRNYSLPGVIGDTTGTPPTDAQGRKELFLKKFSGFVAASYARESVAASKVMHFPLTNGKSQSIPVQGRMGARYHTIGTPLKGLGGPALNEIIINVNKELISDHLTARIDDLMTHWRYEAQVSVDMGRALARSYDQLILRLYAIAAGITHSDLGDNTSNTQLGGLLAGEQQIRTGTLLTATAGSATPDTYVAAFAAAQQALFEKDCPMSAPVAYCTPHAASFVAQSSRALSTEFAGNNGTYQQGSVGRLFGFDIVPTNNIAQGDVSQANDPRTVGENGFESDFLSSGDAMTSAVDMTNFEVLFVGGPAVADVQLSGLQTNVTGNDFYTENRATLMTAAYIMGAGIVNPQCVAALEVQP